MKEPRRAEITTRNCENINIEQSKTKQKEKKGKKNWLEASLKSRTTAVARPTKIDLFAQFQALNPTIQLCEAVGGRMHDCMALYLSMRTKIKVKTRGDDAEQQNNEGEIFFFCEVGVSLVWLQQACAAR